MNRRTCLAIFGTLPISLYVNESEALENRCDEAKINFCSAKCCTIKQINKQAEALLYHLQNRIKDTEFDFYPADQLVNLLENALSNFNLVSPLSNFSLGNVDVYAENFILDYAELLIKSIYEFTLLSPSSRWCTKVNGTIVAMESSAAPPTISEMLRTKYYYDISDWYYKVRIAKVIHQINI